MPAMNQLAHHSLTDQSAPSVADIAATLKAVADPLRLNILRVLAQSSFGVLELSQLFDTKQSGMSHHLKVLAQAGWVSSRREGNSIFYRRAYWPAELALSAVQRELYADIDATEIDWELTNGLTAIASERSAASQAFFNALSEAEPNTFRQQQDLIATFKVYGEPMAQLLEETPLPANGRALELGPGEGEFLTILASQFDRVLALDISEAMLETAKARTAELNNIDYMLGASDALAEQAGFDAIAVNMVLHHTPSPKEIFADLARALNPKGCLVVSELCQHDQAWAKEACGDLWLGFEPQELNRWADESGLVSGRDSYLGLKNGFEIQIRQFFKP